MASGKKLAGNFIYLLLAELTRAVFQFLFIKHISTTLGTEQYGIYLSIFNVINLTYILVNSGLEVYGMREAARFPNKIPRLVGDILILRTILFLFTFALISFYAFSAFDEPMIQDLYLIASLKLLGEALLLNWIFQAKEQIKPVAIRQIFLYFLIYLLFVTLIDKPQDLKIAVWIYAASNPIISIFIILVYIKNYKIKLRIDFKTLKNHFFNALPMGVMLIMIIIYTRSDIEVIKFMTDDPNKSVAIYGSATNLVIITTTLTNIFQQVLFPRLSKSDEKDEKIRNYNFFFNISLFVGIIMTIVFIVWSKELILLQYDETYLEANLLLKILSIKIFLIYLAVSSSSPLLAWGQQKKVMYITILSAILNIIGNLIFVPIFDFYGAAYTTIFAEVLVSTLLAISIFKQINYFNYKLLIRYLVVGGTIGYATFLAYENIESRIIAIFVTVVAAIAIYFACSTFKIKDLINLLRK